MGAGSACATGSFCSETTPGAANCVARVCVADTTHAPSAHLGCLPGAVLRCDARGGASTVMCPAGQSCSVPDGHACVAIGCPSAAGRQAICVGGERVVCEGGAVIERVRCAGVCSTADGIPATCVDAPAADAGTPAGDAGGADAGGAVVPADDAGVEEGDDAGAEAPYVEDDAGDPWDAGSEEAPTTEEPVAEGPGGCSTGRANGRGALALALLGVGVLALRRPTTARRARGRA